MTRKSVGSRTGVLLLWSVLGTASFLTSATATPKTSGTGVSSPEITYTKIDDVRGDKWRICKIMSEDDDVTERQCPHGPVQWPVTFLGADARNFVVFGIQADNTPNAINALHGAFADPHHTIEWRSHNGTPYAAIHRYYYSERQALTVHRLGDNMTSCIVAVVAVAPGRDAYTIASKIADKTAPSFRCGVDQLTTIGKI